MTASAAGDSRWQAPADLVWTHYDDGDDWVVYNPASSDIHLLTASARRLWMLVEEQPGASSDQLARMLAAALARDLDDELAGVTRDTLAFMNRAGLVRPATP